MPEVQRFATFAELDASVPLLDAQLAIADDAPDQRYRYSYANSRWELDSAPDPAQLLPTDGTAGQQLVVDPVLVEPVFAAGVIDAGVTGYDITADASEHVIYDAVQPGGYLGPNGFLRATILGSISNASGANRTLTLKANAGAGPDESLSLVSQAYPTGNTGPIDGQVLLLNQDDDTVQAPHAKLDLARVDNVLLPARQTYAAWNIDTGASFDFQLTLQLSAAGTVVVTIDKVYVERVYVA